MDVDVQSLNLNERFSVEKECIALLCVFNDWVSYTGSNLARDIQ